MGESAIKFFSCKNIHKQCLKEEVGIVASAHLFKAKSGKTYCCLPSFGGKKPMFGGGCGVADVTNLTSTKTLMLLCREVNK